MAQYLTLLYSSWMFMAMLRRCWIWRVFHCDRFKRASGLNLESNRRPCRGQLKLLVEHLPNLAEIRSRCGLDNPGSINVVANLVPSSRSSWYSRISVGSLDPKSFRRISCWISGLQFFSATNRPCGPAPSNDVAGCNEVVITYNGSRWLLDYPLVNVDSSPWKITIELKTTKINAENKHVAILCHFWWQAVTNYQRLTSPFLVVKPPFL